LDSGNSERERQKERDMEEGAVWREWEGREEGRKEEEEKNVLIHLRLPQQFAGSCICCQNLFL
jgi:hypothetical protein